MHALPARSHHPKRLLARAAALSLLVTSGCASAGSWHYAAKRTTPAAATRVQGSRVAVLPFQDLRGNSNKSRALVALLPLVPYAGIDFERIEGGAMFLTHANYQTRPAEDLAKALVAELSASGQFEEVFFTERQKEPNVDFVVRGSVKRLEYESKMITYCLGPFGALLWLLGLPAGKAQNSLEVGLELLDARSGKVVWQSTPNVAEWSTVIGQYYHWSDEFDGFPELYRAQAERWSGELGRVVAAARAGAPAAP